ncbi:diguanylate cyclase [Xanthobacter sp. KR7-65]
MPPAPEAGPPLSVAGMFAWVRRNGPAAQTATDLLLFALFYGCLMLTVTEVARLLGVFPVVSPTDAIAVGVYFVMFRGALGPLALVVTCVSILLHLFAFDDPFGAAMAGGIAHGLTFVLVGWGCLRAGLERDALRSVPMVVSLALVAIVGTLPGAALAAFVAFIETGNRFPPLLLRWWIPEMASVVLLLPPFLLWHGRRQDWMLPKTDRADGRPPALAREEELTLASLTLATAVIASAYYSEPLLRDLGGVILLWFAFRLGLFATAVASGLLSLAIIALGVAQVWPQASADLMTAMLQLEARLVMVMMPALVIAAIMAQRVRQQSEVQEDRRRLAWALEGANDGIWDWHLPTDGVFFSARAHRMLGFEPSEARPRLSDYGQLVHPEDFPALARALSEHAEGRHQLFQTEVRLRHRNGNWLWVLVRGKVVEQDAAGRPARAVGTLTDIAQRKHLEAALEHAATHDPLTGLANRTTFDRALDQARRRLARDGALFAVVLIDIDHFKMVNDKFGHMVGDTLLSTAARRLQSAIRAGDVVARYGGDEFAIIAAGKNKEEFAAMAERLHRQLSLPMEVDGLALPTSFSLGMAVADESAPDSSALLAEADAALYAAKDAGRGTWRAVGIAPRNGHPAPRRPGFVDVPERPGARRA